MAAFWLAAFLENGLGTGIYYGVLWKLLGMYMAMLNYYGKLINEIN